MNTEEINQKYLDLHKTLGKRKDTEDKEAFDIAHRKIWSDCDTELKARKEELTSLSKPAEDERQELSELKMMFPAPRLRSR